ncbi:hypothetical protein CHU98_g7025 [Xylaria longipes]|nr:hypothetical protein CHU98_g7025 [Xylaria longipes]
MESQVDGGLQSRLEMRAEGGGRGRGSWEIGRLEIGSETISRALGGRQRVLLFGEGATRRPGSSSSGSGSGSSSSSMRYAPSRDKRFPKISQNVVMGCWSQTTGLNESGLWK